MSQSNKKILISGCGLSWGGQERKTWVNVFKASGVQLTDVGGPAVSNQWILNKVFLELYNNEYNKVIIQLTSIGKLDVEVNEERIKELVLPDKIRNFTYQNIWPSSASIDHISKQLWEKYLYSPSLEIEDLYCKLVLLKELCKNRNIELFVFQGYYIDWSPNQKEILSTIITEIDDWLYKEYPTSEHYKFHDHTNSVPCLSYQFVLAKKIATISKLDIKNKINKMLEFSSNVVVS